MINFECLKINAKMKKSLEQEKIEVFSKQTCSAIRCIIPSIITCTDIIRTTFSMPRAMIGTYGERIQY